MHKITYKTKQLFFTLIKLSILCCAFYFIYKKLTNNSALDFNTFCNLLFENTEFSAKNIIFLVFLSISNWFFEILKWQTLVSFIKRISFKTASKQSLGSLTASLFTPNRIGEYGAKAIYYTSNYRKRILLVNLISNLLQMSVTLIIGSIGILIFTNHYNLDINYCKSLKTTVIILVIIVLVIIGIRKSKLSIKGVLLKKIKQFIFNYPKRKLILSFLFSLVRYIIFSFQFYFLLYIFKIDISYLNAMVIISSMYLLASIIPSIFIFDVVIKGSIAVYLFTFIGVNELIILSIIGFYKTAIFKLEKIPSKIRFSIIIPFRNEAEHLPALLNSIKNLDYPKAFFEIIFVNDNSSDNSKEKITKHLTYNNLDITIIDNKRISNSPKKDAITTAINTTKNDWIITTDADCILPKNWLHSFDEFIQKNDTTCIAAPVNYKLKNSFLNQFQVLDILSLQGATVGGFGINKPFLCNGANFGYKKSLFKALNGFDGNTNIASGDDIFFLEKVVKKHSNELHYLKCKDAIVTTQSQPSWSSLCFQRIRWAAKTSMYNNWFGKLTGLIVLLMNAMIIITFLLTLIGSLHLKILLYVVVLKLILDFFLIYKSATFFSQKAVLKYFIYAFLIYPFFSVYIAFISIFIGYKWKGRTFKR